MKCVGGPGPCAYDPNDPHMPKLEHEAQHTSLNKRCGYKGVQKPAKHTPQRAATADADAAALNPSQSLRKFKQPPNWLTDFPAARASNSSASSPAYSPQRRRPQSSL